MNATETQKRRQHASAHTGRSPRPSATLTRIILIVIVARTAAVEEWVKLCRVGLLPPFEEGHCSGLIARRNKAMICYLIYVCSYISLATKMAAEPKKVLPNIVHNDSIW